MESFSFGNMSKMERDYIMLLLMLAVLQRVCNTGIYISSQYGDDVVGCGTSENPCKSADYAIPIKVNSNLQIILEGGHNFSPRYIFKRLDIISYNITIEKDKHSQFKPIIIWHTNCKIAFHQQLNLELKFISVFFEMFNISLSHLDNSRGVTKQYLQTGKVSIIIDSCGSNMKNHIMTNSELMQIIVHKYIKVDTAIKNSFVSGVRMAEVDSETCQTLSVMDSTIYRNINISSCTDSSIKNVTIIDNLILSPVIHLRHNKSNTNQSISSIQAETVHSKSIYSKKIFSCIYCNITITNLEFHGHRFNTRYNFLSQNMIRNFAVIWSNFNNISTISETGKIIYVQENSLSLNTSRHAKFVTLSITNSVTSVSAQIAFSFASSLNIKSSETQNTTLKWYTESQGLLHTSNAAEIDNMFLKSTHSIQLSLLCKSNHNPRNSISLVRNPTYYELFCEPCRSGTYTLQGGEQHVVGYIASLTDSSFVKLFQNVQKVKTCEKCPLGGYCDKSIKCRGGFYGFKTKNNRLTFKPCPDGYCCTEKKCKTYNSCNENRKGLLCGSCIKTHYESYFSTKCLLRRSNCSSFAPSKVFWILYILSVVFTTFTLSYLHDITTAAKGTCNGVCTSLKQLLKRDSDVPTATISANVSNITSKPKLATIIGILAGYYQMKELIHINLSEEYGGTDIITKSIENLFNFKLLSIFSHEASCALLTLNAVSKGLIKNFLFPVAVSLIAFILLLLYTVFNWNYQKLDQANKYVLSFPQRLGLCYMRLLLLTYKVIAKFSIKLLHCLEFENHKFLYMYGEIKCYTWWQYGDILFVILWVIMYPLALQISYSLYKQNRIKLLELLVCITFPVATILYKIKRKWNIYDNQIRQSSKGNEKIKELLWEQFQEPYRIIDGKNHLFLESLLLYQRLVLASVSIFIVDPVERILYMTPIIILFIFIYLLLKPYNDKMSLLHWMHISSLLSLCFILVFNLLRSFIYMYDIPYRGKLPVILKAFFIVDAVFSPITVLLYSFFVEPILNNISKCFLKKD